MLIFAKINYLSDFSLIYISKTNFSFLNNTKPYEKLFT
jgi:hypothetical protein